MFGEPSRLNDLSWDAVRATRRRVLGNETYKLNPDNVPSGLRPVVPMAALLGVGEEGLFEELYAAMSDDARAMFWAMFREFGETIRAFVATEESHEAERYAFLNLLRFAEATDE